MLVASKVLRALALLAAYRSAIAGRVYSNETPGANRPWEEGRKFVAVSIKHAVWWRLIVPAVLARPSYPLNRKCWQASCPS